MEHAANNRCLLGVEGLDAHTPHCETRVLIVAPTGSDSANAAEVLTSERIPSVICESISEMCKVAREGAGALLITQEGLTHSGLSILAGLLQDQGPWSDMPLILISGGTDAAVPGLTLLRSLSYSNTVTVLERPLRVLTLVSAVKTALRARRRQYQLRDLLGQREQMMVELQERTLKLEISQYELLKAKEEISRHAEELKRTVAERTARLREVVAQLEAFSYSISHDMRGPLRAMQQYAQILLEDCRPQLNEEACDYLERIARASNRLDRLIQDLLTYSRAARSEIPLVTVDLDKLVKEVIQQYPALQSPRAKVEVLGPLPRVIGHEASLMQCIANLLANAVKFVPKERPPRVRVYPGEVNGRVQVWFEDNGIGIAPENHQRIFNIFERVCSETEYEGTGIGLSIVKKTVERMGGDVGLESELGRGSRFWIRLPPAERK